MAITREQHRRSLKIAAAFAAGFLVLVGIGAITAAANSGSGSQTSQPAAPTSTEPDIVLPPAPPEKITMPDGLVGQNALIVHDQLRDLGFTNITYASADKADSMVILAQNWRVTKVEPGAGSQIKPEATIVLTCTKAQT